MSAAWRTPSLALGLAICAAQIDDPTGADYAFRPSLRALLERAAKSLP